MRQLLAQRQRVQQRVGSPRLAAQRRSKRRGVRAFEGHAAESNPAEDRAAGGRAAEGRAAEGGGAEGRAAPVEDGARRVVSGRRWKLPGTEQNDSPAAAAATGDAVGHEVSASTAALSGASGAARLTQCVVCCDRPTAAVLYRCGHQCACLRCAYYMHSQRLPCPLCRAPIDDIIRVYHP